MIIDERDINIIYVANDVGVFCPSDGGKNWKELGVGLPNVQVYDMRLFYPKNLLRIVTHGRGMWQLQLGQV